MDLGCFDLGCVEKEITRSSADDSDINPNGSLLTTSKTSKNKALKDVNQWSPLALNRSTTQIKKPTRRKTSPLGWFPRKRVDSYLKRKIKLLQEVGGMSSTLDETLGDSNPHYSKVLREKMAVREAAYKAMEARKAALVEASWCRILRAARIESKDAEDLLVKAEKVAEEAFESAKEIGVIMYDMPDCPRKHYEIEMSTVNGGESTTHKVRTSFETAFEVDKQVAAAVKDAFVRLSTCPSISKEEFKELLKRVSQNPDLEGHNQDTSNLSSVCESDAETGSHKEEGRMESTKEKQRDDLVEMMLQRLRCLQEDELASLATIVATCGLSAALAEAENGSSSSHVDGHRSFGEGRARNSGMNIQTSRKQQVDTELPSLDKFLVKRLTRLEREVQDAKNARKNKETNTNGFKKAEEEGMVEKNHKTLNVVEADLGSMLIKHSSKLEKEIEESKRTCGNSYEAKGRRSERWKQDMKDVPSLDKFLVKHVSRLEREVQEAKKDKENVNTNKGRDKDFSLDACPEKSIMEAKKDKENVIANKERDKDLSLDACHEKSILEATEALSLDEENMGDGKETENGLDKILVKPVHRLEKEKKEALSLGWSYESMQRKNRDENNEMESLDKVLVKYVSTLEKEKTAHSTVDGGLKRTDRKVKQMEEASEGSLDQILVKHKSRLEREKMGAAEEPEDIQTKIKNPLVARREARERELQEAWGGMSFGNAIRPHLSRLQRDKAAWLKAEQEETGKKEAWETN